jgi:hypothetical protein
MFAVPIIIATVGFFALLSIVLISIFNGDI